MTVLLESKVMTPEAEVVDLYNKEHVARVLKEAYWAVFTTDVDVIGYWSRKVYDMVSTGEAFEHLLKTRENFDKELVGMIIATSSTVKYISRLGGSMDCGFLAHELALSAMLKMAALSGIYDSVRVQDGYSDGVFYVVVHFSDNIPIEDIIRRGVEETKRNSQK